MYGMEVLSTGSYVIRVHQVETWLTYLEMRSPCSVIKIEIEIIDFTMDLKLQ